MTWQSNLLFRLALAPCLLGLTRTEVCTSEATCAAQDLDEALSAMQLPRRESRRQAGLAAPKQQRSRVTWYEPMERDLALLAPDTSPAETAKAPASDFHAEGAQAPPQPPVKGMAYQRKTMWNAPELMSEPLVEPALVSSHNGLLETTLEVTWGWIELPTMGIRVRNRLYNGTYPGPTLRVMRGDRVTIHVNNKLGPNQPDDTKFQRREGQAGVPKDSWQYIDVGQSPKHPSQMGAMENNMHNPNSTNLHVHGWHVSPLVPQDEVVSTLIPPGTNYTYSYELSSYHASGNSWYHGHLHGTTMLQTGGGMVGALIIEDSPGEAPKWLTDLPDVIAVIHEARFGYFGPEFLKYNPQDSEFQGCFPFNSVYTWRCTVAGHAGLMANLSGDLLWKMEYAEGFGYRNGEVNPIGSAYTVNGQYMPTVTVKTGEWVRLRLIYAGDNLPLNLIFDGTGTPCEMRLIAKDSAWLQTIPRLLTRGVFLGAGNRCQVIMRCTQPGTWGLRNNMPPNANSDLDGHQTLLFVKAEGAPDQGFEPPQWVVPRPRYLQSLVNLNYSMIENPNVLPAKNWFNNITLTANPPNLQKNNKTMTTNLAIQSNLGNPRSDGVPPYAYKVQPQRFVVQNMTFSHEHPFADFPVAKILEVEMMGLSGHPWHMHVNPAQLQSFGATDYYARWGGYYEIGDWQDVFQLPTADWPDLIEGPNNATAVVRFQTDCYTGALVLHCHVLYHEDLGMMTWFNMTGENHQYSPHFDNEGIFKSPPPQCMKPGQQCAPAWCTDYKYA